MLAAGFALSLLAVSGPFDGGLESRDDRPPLDLDGGTIEFFPDAGSPPPDPRWLHIRGNRVLPEEMYRNALRLPEGAQADAATATYIEETLYGFLVKSGYELATVGAVLTPDGIDVEIDEGQLEKVVFTGRLTFNTLRFRLELFIDQEVFNRPALERQIAQLSERIGLKVVRWALVPTRDPDHVGPQIETIGPIEGFQIIKGRKRFELWFFFQEAEWDTGVGVDVRSGYIDGLEVGLNYQGNGVVGDHWRVAASAGAGLHYRIYDHMLVPDFSRAFTEFQWFSRQLDRVRVGLWLTGNLVKRTRKDLDVETYMEASSVASVGTAISIGGRNNANITPTFGVQWRSIFNINPIPNANPALVPETSKRLRGFVELRAQWTVDPENQRWDRRHWLELGGRYYFGSPLDLALESGPRFLSYGWVFETYRKVFEFGWHDLWLTSRARAAFGDVQFHDEENLGELLRGVFGDIFVRKDAATGVEFRFSLARDVLKLSLFTNVAVFGEVCRGVAPGGDAKGACSSVPKDHEVLRVGISGGPGLHALIQGMFQLDVYASFGVISTAQTSIALVVLLNKTY